MRVTLDHIEELAPNIKMYWFASGHMPKYKAGQFTELFLPHKNKDKRGDKRWFTISSAPSEPMLAITTKFALEKGSSFKAALGRLKLGDELHLAQPMGDFTLPKDSSKKLIFVAGGIGITPIRSMIKSLLDSNTKRGITLIYAATSAKEIVFTNIFKNARVRFIPVLAQANPGWVGETGRLDADRVLSFIDDLPASLIYLSGPDPMVKALAKGLKEQGVSNKQLLTDYFPGYTEL